LKPYKFLIFSFIIFCSTVSTYSYTIESDQNMDIINTNLSINTERISNTKYKVTIQSFPQKNKDIVNYKLVFDMKFRDDYESEFNGVCIGPNWDVYGPGEFTIHLDNQNNFKNSIKGTLTQESDDRCNNYFYYARFLDMDMKNGDKYLIGVATDYGGLYPDAPNVWKLDSNNEIELIFTSNIERYSINFELSK